MPQITNLNVALSGFWQLVRPWKTGEKAKHMHLCEDGNIHIQFFAVLDNPDHSHFA